MAVPRTVMQVTWSTVLYSTTRMWEVDSVVVVPELPADEGAPVEAALEEEACAEEVVAASEEEVMVESSVMEIPPVNWKNLTPYRGDGVEGPCGLDEDGDDCDDDPEPPDAWTSKTGTTTL